MGHPINLILTEHLLSTKEWLFNVTKCSAGKIYKMLSKKSFPAHLSHSNDLLLSIKDESIIWSNRKTWITLIWSRLVPSIPTDPGRRECHLMSLLIILLSVLRVWTRSPCGRLPPLVPRDPQNKPGNQQVAKRMALDSRISSLVHRSERVAFVPLIL